MEQFQYPNGMIGFLDREYDTIVLPVVGYDNFYGECAFMFKDEDTFYLFRQFNEYSAVAVEIGETYVKPVSLLEFYRFYKEVDQNKVLNFRCEPYKDGPANNNVLVVEDSRYINMLYLFIKVEEKHRTKLRSALKCDFLLDLSEMTLHTLSAENCPKKIDAIWDDETQSFSALLGLVDIQLKKGKSKEEKDPIATFSLYYNTILDKMCLEVVPIKASDSNDEK